MEVGAVIADRFTIVQKLVAGGCGILFLVCDPNHKVYVLKAEEASMECCSVKREIAVYVALGHSFIDSPVLGIPRIFYHGTHRENGLEFYVIVMEYLERSLGDRMIDNGGTLSLKSVLMVGIQILRILEDIHDRGFVHRDVKPDNILTGLAATDCSSLFLCDFGMAKYIPFHSQEESNAKCVYGTLDFASRRALQSKEQGRCDDLESLGYTLIFLKYGSLPWQGIPFPPDGKQSAAVRGIYYDYIWKDLPPEMKMFVEYVKTLDVREKPDYDYLRSLLNVPLASAGMTNDGQFEWSPVAEYLPYSEEDGQMKHRDGVLEEVPGEQTIEQNDPNEDNETDLPSLIPPIASDAEEEDKFSPVSRTEQHRSSRGVSAALGGKRRTFMRYFSKTIGKLLAVCA
ncbi:unnamed protein product [Agarophyton chilense]|eukprot:gb/GEZJ01003930.1/.p1 GENE.gb/GEZJ01003930.1/~~gb/GEZJ01003930.1/.p1  ORF type:complete len:399 (+),score=57.20 gb/GEZJ01003930.1/:51-1247(+)